MKISVKTLKQMRFKELSDNDKQYIKQIYLDNASKDADRIISEAFDAAERTVRSWANRLGLTKGSKVEDIDVEEPEVVRVKDDTYYWNLLSKDIQYTPKDQYYPPIMHEEGGSRVLVVGDLHTPFDLTEYLFHLKKVYDMYQCNRVVFIGDVIDSHYSSFHNTDPNGMGGGDELDYAIARIQRYRQVFPEADAVLGNHCRIVARKAFAGGIPKQWLKDFNEVLQVPGWNFVTEVEIDGVLYFHGEGGTAKTKMKSELQSVVQGHLHTQAYIEWAFSKSDRIFGMQVGTGIDFDQYAFAYAKAGKKPAISCGVVLNGKYPVLVPMDL